jgi:hypothetical protein
MLVPMVGRTIVARRARVRHILPPAEGKHHLPWHAHRRQRSRISSSRRCFSLRLRTREDINLYINSPGGSITAGLAILDTMNLVEPDITTYCVGQAASMGAVLLAAGRRESDTPFRTRVSLSINRP